MTGEQLNIDDGDSFFAHEMSVNFNPTQFILDFKNITPRVDMRSKDRPSLNLKHNVVMVEPYHFKLMIDLMKKIMKKYEDEYGKIEKPQTLKKAEQRRKKMIKEGKKPKMSAPTYFG